MQSLVLALFTPRRLYLDGGELSRLSLSPPSPLVGVFEDPAALRAELQRHGHRCRLDLETLPIRRLLDGFQLVAERGEIRGADIVKADEGLILCFRLVGRRTWRFRTLPQDAEIVIERLREWGIPLTRG